ncbi:FecR family protein [Rubrivirga sp. IMCC45206]|uniref:FecR family protein n=1 Tax=Rubrivirga sp. IMCC45206 TaxID=3391614 RepID=UPI00398FB598
MRDTDALAFFDALPPDERAALDAAVAAEPALAEAFARWRSLRAAVRADLARDLPDRVLLVLYALADPDLLSDAEQARVDQARPALDAALAKHPGLAAAVRRIRADRDAFEAAWADAASEPAETAPTLASLPKTSPFPTGEGQPEAGVRQPTGRRSQGEGQVLRKRADRQPLRLVRPTRWVMRAAAVFAVVAFGAVLTQLYLRDAGWETLAGAQTVTFEDGTTVQLADNARLAVPDDRGRQARLLAGEALFRVTRNPDAPFSVTTPNADVVVLGTTFAVDASDVRTEVTLVTGAVTVAPRETPAAAVTLAPGQRTTVLALDAPSAPARADLGALAWTGVVFATDQTAGEIARQLSARFDVPVSVAPTLASVVIGGTAEFGREGLRDAVDKLALSLGARVEADGRGFRIVE